MSTSITVDGRKVAVEPGISVAAALLNAGITGFRRSVAGETRAPVCGMGICFECRVSIDGVPHERACLRTVRDGMEVRTGA
jgi:D-hydroxyproline dehydrogenase subunit gamma